MARQGTMFEKEIESKYLNETMTLKIYQPESISTIYKSNICIMQDGNDYYQLGRIATLSDKFHSDFEITNTIFVGIHYIDRYDRLKKYHPEGEQQKAYIQFLVHEVIPLLDDILPTNPLGKTQALLGDSLAGTIALMTAISYPTIFDKVIMQSPYVDETVLNMVRNAENIHSIDIYHTIGPKETAVATTEDGKVDFVNPNRDLNELLQSKIDNYIYYELENGDHTWKYWQKDLPRAITSIFD